MKRPCNTIGWIGGMLLALGLLAAPAVPRSLAADPTAPTNLVAWCIVPFDTVRRGPEERAALLQRLGLSQLAYDWRAEHIPTFDAEVAALQRHGIHLRAWWFPSTLNAEAEAILACLRRHRIHPELWVMAGDPPGASQEAKVRSAADALRPVVKAAAELGCRVGLYNHGGWFGQPENQLAIRARLAELGHDNVGLVYNLHHGHDHLERLPSVFPRMVPHLLAVNLNGTTWDGERLGRKILPFGSGEYDAPILQLLRQSGYRGPVGILGHTEEDVAVKLRKDLDGLHAVEARLAQGDPAPWPKPGPRPSSSTPSPAAGTDRAAAKPTPADAGTPKVSGMEPGAQKEQDWVDNRWSQMDVGPAFASNLHLPDGSVIAKALTVQLPGPGQQCVAYDLATGTLRAAWTGGFLRFDPMRFGLMGGQKPATAPWFLSSSKAGFPGARYRFLGLRHAGAEVLLEHEVDGVRVEEQVRVGAGPSAHLVRALRVEAHARPLRVTLGRSGEGQPEAGRRDGLAWMDWGRGATRVVAAIEGAAGSLVTSPDGEVQWEWPASNTPQAWGVWLGAGGTVPAPVPGELRQDPRQRLETTRAGLAKPHVLTTRGQRGADTDILAVDTLTLPYDNPYKALLFGSGVDLMPDGTAYLCTMHGDVWRVTGIDASLRELRWVRFATGLFQPLGLKVRRGQVFVLGRDRITRLEDTDGDGVADHYVNFHDGIQTSTGGHDYVTCLEQDVAGNLYYVDPLGLHRVSADGRETALLAAGFRNPNGMGVSPDGNVLTVAPQQGTRTPSSGIWQTHPGTPGRWGGYPEPRVTAERPLGYDAPLCWIPHGVDNSSGSQVWVPGGRWGPLGGHMLHLLWGRCTLMLVLPDAAEGRENGLVVPLPAKFLAGPNRGSFLGDDLFVAGSTGWQTSALRDGSLQRVRWTGKRFLRPVGWRTRPDGIDLAFDEPLRKDTATDVGSYAVRRWNYRYSADYGSKDWSVEHPDREGRDTVAVSGATLGADGRTVSLQLGALGPVMQFEVKYNLDAADGKPVRGSVWGTVNPVR